MYTDVGDNDVTVISSVAFVAERQAYFRRRSRWPERV